MTRVVEGNHHRLVMPVALDSMASSLKFSIFILGILSAVNIFSVWDEFSFASNMWTIFWVYLILAIGYAGAAFRHHGLLAFYYCIRLVQLFSVVIIFMIWLFVGVDDSTSTWALFNTTGTPVSTQPMPFWYFCLALVYSLLYISLFCGSASLAWRLRTAIIHNILVTVAHAEMHSVQAHQHHEPESNDIKMHITTTTVTPNTPPPPMPMPTNAQPMIYQPMVVPHVSADGTAVYAASMPAMYMPLKEMPEETENHQEESSD